MLFLFFFSRTFLHFWFSEFLRKCSFWKIPTQSQLNKRKEGLLHKGLWVRGEPRPLGGHLSEKLWRSSRWMDREGAREGGDEA